MFSPAGPCLLRLLGCVAAFEFNAPALIVLPPFARSVEAVFIEEAEEQWYGVRHHYTPQNAFRWHLE